jgi:E3 ubiquitin-protein ligase DOA10
MEESEVEAGKRERTDLELNLGSTGICRICFSSEANEGNLLIRPCKCSGTVAYCHQICLRQWVQCKHFSEPICEICHSELHFEPASKKDWSFCAFMKSFACLIIFLSLPIQIVLLVTIAKVGKDLSNHTNLYVFIGCLCGVILTLGVSAVLIVWSCLSKLKSKWRVVPQNSETSLPYVIP